MARRSKARQVALQMLYQVDVNDTVDGETIRGMIEEQLSHNDLQQFAWSLYAGAREHRPAIDKEIEAVAENWTLGRMAPTDRNVLRLGGFELLYTDTPHRVVIDESIELARKFGTANSAHFVNGILDKMVPGKRRVSSPR